MMINLMNGLHDLGIGVDILLNNPDIPERRLLTPGIGAVELGDVDGLRRVPPLVRYFRERRPDWLLANREPAVRAATLANRLGGCGVPVAVRVGMAVSVALERRGPVKRILRRAAIRHCYRRASLVIANDPAVAEDVAEAAGIDLAGIRVLPNPTVSPELSLQASEPVDHPWFAAGGPKVIVGVGRLARQKDFPTLLRATALLRKQLDCRLVVLGEGKERPALERLAKELGLGGAAAFPGHVANPFAFMSRADLFVLSSAWEGSPNVLIQALALGVPSVATDCRSGPRRILDDGRYGPLVPVEDPDALADAMEKTLTAPPRPSFLREGAERYRSDVCCRRYAEALGLLEATHDR